MDFETFDNDTTDDDAAYFAFVEWLSALTAAELRAATPHDRAQLRVALCRYFGRGARANLTPGELVDFLGVSTPSILERAGFTPAQADHAMALADALTAAEIEGADLSLAAG